MNEEETKKRKMAFAVAVIALNGIVLAFLAIIFSIPASMVNNLCLESDDVPVRYEHESFAKEPTKIITTAENMDAIDTVCVKTYNSSYFDIVGNINILVNHND